MEQKLLEVIKANLPEATAGEMKEFIEQAEQTKKNLEISEKELEKLHLKIDLNEKDLRSKDDFISEKEKEISGLKDQINKCEDCKDRYLQLGYKEQIMDIQNQHSIARVNDAKEYLGIAFKSPVFKKEVATTKGIVLKAADYMDYNTNQSLSGGEAIQDRTDIETSIETED